MWARAPCCFGLRCVGRQATPRRGGFGRGAFLPLFWRLQDPSRAHGNAQRSRAGTTPWALPPPLAPLFCVCARSAWRGGLASGSLLFVCAGAVWRLCGAVCRTTPSKSRTSARSASTLYVPLPPCLPSCLPSQPLARLLPLVHCNLLRNRDDAACACGSDVVGRAPFFVFRSKWCCLEVPDCSGGWQDRKAPNCE